MKFTMTGQKSDLLIQVTA